MGWRPGGGGTPVPPNQLEQPHLGADRVTPYLGEQDGQVEDGAIERGHVPCHCLVLLQHGKARAPALHLGAAADGNASPATAGKSLVF